jgi:hypothetical protein
MATGHASAILAVEAQPLDSAGNLLFGSLPHPRQGPQRLPPQGGLEVVEVLDPKFTSQLPQRFRPQPGDLQ